MKRWIAPCAGLCSLLLAGAASGEPERVRLSEWTVTNEGPRALRITYERRGFIGQRDLAPGQELTVKLRPAIYQVEFKEGSRRVRRRIDLRRRIPVHTRYPLATLEDPAPHDAELRLSRWRRTRARPRRGTPPSVSGRLHLSLECFGGVALTSSGEIKLLEEYRLLGIGDSREHTIGAVDTTNDTTPSFGIRGGIGYAFGRVPLTLGGAVEWSQFSATGGPVRRFRTNAVSLLAMSRALFGRDAEHPYGHFQLHLGLGLGIYITDAELRIPSTAQLSFPTRVDEDGEVNVGFELRLGATVPLIGPLALYCEYRLSLLDYRTKVGDAPALFFYSGNVYVERVVLTNHFVAGVSLQF